MYITHSAPPQTTRTLTVTLTQEEARLLDQFLLDGPGWTSHPGGPLAEQLTDVLNEVFNL